MINFIHNGKAAAAAPNVHVASELAEATTTTKSLAFTGFDHTTTAGGSGGGLRLTRQCTEWKWNPMFYYNTLLPSLFASLQSNTLDGVTRGPNHHIERTNEGERRRRFPIWWRTHEVVGPRPRA